MNGTDLRVNPDHSRSFGYVARVFGFLIACALTAGALHAEEAALPPLSEETEACIACHEAVTPGIVEDWRRSRHARSMPSEALTKPALERRISAESVPPRLAQVAVGCYECHSLNAEAHTDNFDHFDFQINIVVSPPDCATCHPAETKEYAKSKKAHAVGNLEKNPIYSLLVATNIGVKEVRDDGEILAHAPSEAAKMDACFGCHGTHVEVKGTRRVETDLGPIEVPNLTNWPSQGVGRINPDGSMGACTACHPRHGFSIATARKPYTCGQCHLEPDVPALNVYKESKHGNMYSSEGGKWNWDAVPWKVGADFKAPTCAACHVSLLTGPDGKDVIAPQTHDFGARLWVRLFGLPYAHPQPRHGDTSVIRNADGQPLPTTFGGVPASEEYLLSEKEQADRKAVMQGVCKSCHSTQWTEGHFAKMEKTVEETNLMTLAATRLVQEAWARGLADPENPFDENIEQLWVEQWVFYASSTRYASAMSGPDYAAFKNGWWELTRNLQRMRDFLKFAAGEEPAKKKRGRKAQK